MAWPGSFNPNRSGMLRNRLSWFIQVNRNTLLREASRKLRRFKAIKNGRAGVCIGVSAQHVPRWGSFWIQAQWQGRFRVDTAVIISTQHQRTCICPWILHHVQGQLQPILNPDLHQGHTSNILLRDSLHMMLPFEAAVPQLPHREHCWPAMHNRRLRMVQEFWKLSFWLLLVSQRLAIHKLNAAPGTFNDPASASTQ